MIKNTKDKEFVDFGKCIRHVRLKNKLTQAEFGAIIGKSQSTIYAYENNMIIPPFRVLITISDIFHVPVGELMDIKESLSIEALRKIYFELTGIKYE